MAMIERTDVNHARISTPHRLMRRSHNTLDRRQTVRRVFFSEACRESVALDLEEETELIFVGSMQRRLLVGRGILGAICLAVR